MEKKWYRQAFVKGVLVVLATVSLAAAVLGFSWLGFGIGPEYLNPMKEVPKSYEETAEFRDGMELPFRWIGQYIKVQEKLIKDGKLDEKQIVDVERYYKDNKITGENTSGFAYELKDLLETQNNDETETAPTETGDLQVVVCQKADGGYHYEYWNNFRAKILNKELAFAELVNASVEEGRSEYDLMEEYLDRLGNNYDSYDSGKYFGICDAEGRLIYTDCCDLLTVIV